MALLSNFFDLFIESAPWLLLGLLVAGLVKAFISADTLARHLGDSDYKAVAKAAFFGAPLPLCSCGVIPAAIGLRRNGASKAATTSFLISTPETGIDSISLSYVLLGPFMAIIRPIAALTTAITAGLMVGKDDTPNDSSTSSTCSSCCSNNTQPTPKEPSSLVNRLLNGIRFTAIDLVNDITKWLLIGLVLAALIKTYVPTEFLVQWGDSAFTFVLMALIGVPMYICATASTPIAASLLISGVSPGAVLVFLLVGPATNIGTLGLVNKELGKRTLIIYLSSVVLVSFAFGYAANYIVNHYGLSVVSQAEHAQHIISAPIAYGCSAILALLMMNSFFKKKLA